MGAQHAGMVGGINSNPQLYDKICPQDAPHMPSWRPVPTRVRLA